MWTYIYSGYRSHHLFQVFFLSCLYFARQTYRWNIIIEVYEQRFVSTGPILKVRLRQQNILIRIL